MITLSVVIPTFDTAQMTLSTVESVLASSPPGTEVIVVDDASSDGTHELLARAVPSVRVVRLESNRGFATAANRGVAEARGSVVLLLNSDAVPQPGAISALADAFAQDPRLGVAGAQLVEPDGSPQWSGGRTPTLAWMIGVVSGAGGLARLVRRRREPGGEVDWVSGAAMAFRRETWRDAGPLDERYRFYCQDIDFCLRARDAGWGGRIVPSARVTHARGATIAPAQRYDPARLWPDLLTWGAARYGGAWSLFARAALTGVALLRVALRTIRGRDTTAMRLAIRRLLQSDS